MEMLIKEHDRITSVSVNEKVEKVSNEVRTKKYNYSEEGKAKAINKINMIMRSFKNKPDSVNRIYNLFIMSEKDIDIIDELVSEYINNCGRYRSENSKEDHYNSIYNTIHKTLKYSIDEILKKVSIMYFDNLVKDMPIIRVSECENLLEGGFSPMDLLSDLNIEFDKKAKKNGVDRVSATAFAGAIKKYYLMNRHHLCFDCPYDYCYCSKFMSDWENISKYPYITEGAQIVDNGEIKKFYVYKCALESQAREKQIKLNK